MLKLPQDRAERALLVLVVALGAVILAGTAFLIVALVDLAVQLGTGAAAPPPALPRG